MTNDIPHHHKHFIHWSWSRINHGWFILAQATRISICVFAILHMVVIIWYFTRGDIGISFCLNHSYFLNFRSLLFSYMFEWIQYIALHIKHSLECIYDPSIFFMIYCMLLFYSLFVYLIRVQFVFISWLSFFRGICEVLFGISIRKTNKFSHSNM